MDICVTFGLNEGVGDTDPGFMISLVSLDVEEFVGFLLDDFSLSCFAFCRCLARRFLNHTFKRKYYLY